MKRFADSAKWDKPWFRKMKPRYKSFLQYIWDRCDSAGVWSVDLELAEAYVGEKLDAKEAIRVFDGRVVDFGEGKWLVPDFVSFQYGELTFDCKAHRPIILLVEKHGLIKQGKGYRKGIDRVSPVSEYPSLSLQEKEKEKEKEKEGGPGETQVTLTLQAPPPEIRPEELAEEIYQLYPLKAGKPAAISEIIKALKRRDSIFLRERTDAYAKAVAGTDTLIPHPSTWFHQERFNDDPSTWVRQKPNPANGHVEKKPLSVHELRAVIEAKEQKAQALKNRYASEGPLSTDWSDDAKRKEFCQLRREIKELKEKLANYA
jgi:hypothetical protein